MSTSTVARPLRRRNVILLCLVAVVGLLLVPSFGGAAPAPRGGASASVDGQASVLGTNASVRAEANAQAILRPAQPLPRQICGLLRSFGLGWVIQLLQRLGIRPCASP